MVQYIPKDAVLAIIDKKMVECFGNAADFVTAKKMVLIELKSAINSLEVKVVDLEDEIERIRKHHYINGDFDKAEIDGITITNIAKHFFNLGVNANLEQRIQECPFRETICNRYEDKPAECDGHCSWVVDCPILK